MTTFHQIGNPAETCGWQDHSAHGVTLWSLGHLYQPSWDSVAQSLGEASGDLGKVKEVLATLRGHFALIATTGDWTLGAVDRSRTIPLAFAEDQGRLHLAPQAHRLAERLNRKVVAGDGSRAFAMAGYTIGHETIFDGIKDLLTGQFVLQTGSEPHAVQSYHRYEPWRVDRADDASLVADLEAVTLKIMEKVAGAANGRTIAVPLSAGYDSRLIASSLRQIGYDNVVCFSYGLPGNYEAKAAQAIAKRLNYPWRFFAYEPKTMAAFFETDVQKDYLDRADNGAATPFHQDLPALLSLRADGYIPSDAVIINGNSGDYISGLHIAPALHQAQPALSVEDRLDLIIDTMIKKHFRLWGAFAGGDHDAIISRQLRTRLNEEGLVPSDPETDFALYEFLELQARQSKFVVGGQRVYEFLGHDWLLPLWDDDYLDFWQRVPRSAKVGQRLYRDMLHGADWGRVWNDQALWPERTVQPAWMRLAVRPFCKLLHAPFGRDAWHRFERRFLSYWTENLQGQAMHPYGTICRDNRDARHMVSWHTEAYLNSHDLDWRGEKR